ncbi:MAG: DNA primase [Spirochaetaceae bacterium]|nr:DNA primase [Myxococcales bacterium]MCB9724097.1 DNA primase [Spirochaetaceae bacterium]HPG26237.1 DNA primase [Myxococcota bacterium]
MSRIPEATIQEIRSRADIVGLVSRYVELKQAGRNWKGLCPFHNEKTPSFNVNPDRQIFHCFGCQEGGDVVGFLMKHEGLTFPEAARQLAGELGIEIPEEHGAGDRGRTAKLFEANDAAQDLYREALREPEGKPARDYLVSRGFDGKAADRFGLGFAPDRWDAVAERLRRKRIAGEIGAEAGLLAQRKSGSGHYDRLRGRLTFPIRDVRGRLIGFGGRALAADQEPKYLNTPESPIFQKRQSFYGYPDALEPIRRAGRVILCEGYFDQIAFARAGLGEALATCGTALTPDHASQLRRRTKEVVLVFDGDAAGQQATEKALAVLLPSGLRVRAALIPGGGDPDDYLRAHGDDALRRLVDEAPDALELVIRNALRQGASTPDQKADAVAHVAPLIARVADAVSRDEYARRLAMAVGASESAVATIVRKAARNDAQAPQVDGEDLGLARGRRDVPEERQLRALARLCLQRPELIGDETALRLQDILPEGAWKAIVLLLVEAAADGLVGPGGVDAFAIESRLDEETTRRLREISIDDTPIDSERTADQVLDDLIGWFEGRRLAARERELKRRMRDPGEDHEALLAERHALLLERRARMGVGRASASRAAGDSRVDTVSTAPGLDS